MPLFSELSSYEVPVKIGTVTINAYITGNIYVRNEECHSEPHNHEDFELRYVVSGECIQRIDEKEYDLRAGDLLLVHPCEYHFINNFDNVELYNFCFIIDPSKKNTDKRQIKLYNATLKTLQNIRLLNDKKGELLKFFSMLANEVYSKEAGYIDSIQAICKLIFIQVLRIADNENAIDMLSNDYRGYKSYIHDRIEYFFSKKFFQNVTLADLASDMNVSKRQASRILNKLFGCSFTQKLNETRLIRVVYTLEREDASLAELSLSCGFQDYSHFFRCFKKKYGISPTEFKDSIKKGVGSKP